MRQTLDENIRRRPAFPSRRPAILLSPARRPSIVDVQFMFVSVCNFRARPEGTTVTSMSSLCPARSSCTEPRYITARLRNGLGRRRRHVTSQNHVTTTGAVRVVPVRKPSFRRRPWRSALFNENVIRRLNINKFTTLSTGVVNDTQ